MSSGVSGIAESRGATDGSSSVRSPSIENGSSAAIAIKAPTTAAMAEIAFQLMPFPVACMGRELTACHGESLPWEERRVAGILTTPYPVGQTSPWRYVCPGGRRGPKLWTPWGFRVSPRPGVPRTVRRECQVCVREPLKHAGLRPLSRPAARRPAQVRRAAEGDRAGKHGIRKASPQLRCAAPLLTLYASVSIVGMLYAPREAFSAAFTLSLVGIWLVHLSQALRTAYRAIEEGWVGNFTVNAFGTCSVSCTSAGEVVLT